MAIEDDLRAELVAAHKAGDVERASQIAARLRAMREIVAAHKAGDTERAGQIAAQLREGHFAPDAAAMADATAASVERREKLAEAVQRDREEYSPVAGASFTENLLAGLGKRAVDVGRSAAQAVGAIDQADVSRSRELDDPLMRTGGGLIGNIAGEAMLTALPFSAAARAPSAAARLGGYTATGAASGGLLMPYGEGESRISNAGRDAVATLVGEGVGKVMRGVARGRSATTPEAVRKAVRDAKELGIPVYSYQISGDPGGSGWVARTVGGMSNRLPPVPGFTPPIEKQREAIGRALLREAGLEAKDGRITQEAIDAIKDRAGKVFDAIDSHAVPMDRQLASDIGRIWASSQQIIDDASRSQVQRVLKNVVGQIKANNGVLTPGVWRQAKQLMDKGTKTGGQQSVRDDAMQLMDEFRDVLIEAKGRNVPKDLMDEYAKARRQYAITRQVLEPLARSEAGTGLPTAARVSQVLGSARVAPQLDDRMRAIHAAAGLAKRGYQSSGTAENQTMLRAIAPWAAAGAGAYGVASATGTDLADIAPWLAGAYGVRYLVHRPALTGYLVNGMPAWVQRPVTAASRGVPSATRVIGRPTGEDERRRRQSLLTD